MKKKKEKTKHKQVAIAEIKHKGVLKTLSENVGNGKKRKTMTEAMIENGYSESYAKSGRIKDTRSWATLLKEELPDTKLMERLGVLLKSRQVQKFVFPSRMKDPEIIQTVEAAGFKVVTIRPSPIGKMAFYSIENAHAIDKGLTHAFKLKGKYEAEEFNLKFQGFTRQQLIDSIMSKLTKKK